MPDHTTAVAVSAPQGGGLAIYNEEEMTLIKQQIAPKATDNELKLFAVVAKRSGLDPFAKQIYCIHRNVYNPDTKQKEPRMTIQTGIDGYRTIAHRTGEMAGIDDAVFEEAPGGKHPLKATVTVYRFHHGQRIAYTASARWEEYFQGYDGKPTGNWESKPYLMLAKCAEALALRKAFPNDLSGIYVEEETQSMDNVAVAEVSLNAPAPDVDLTQPVGEDTKNAILAELEAKGKDTTKMLNHFAEKVYKRVIDRVSDFTQGEAVEVLAYLKKLPKPKTVEVKVDPAAPGGDKTVVADVEVMPPEDKK